MKNDQKVKRYFEEGAKEFDYIYDWMEGSLENKYINILSQLFRKGMVERFNLALKECESNKTVLDIGCGSGRISIELAKKGATVKAIDYSEKMIKLANQYLNEQKKENENLKIKFEISDFLKNFNSKKKYEIIFAIGLFDYIKNAFPVLEKIKNLTQEKIIVSFPKKFTFQTPLRKIWLLKRRCPVYFYTKKKINNLYKNLGLFNTDIIEISAGYFVKTII